MYVYSPMYCRALSGSTQFANSIVLACRDIFLRFLEQLRLNYQIFHLNRLPM